MNSDALKKGGTLFSVSKQSNKAISRKGYCFRGRHFLVYRNKAISKKKGHHFRDATVATTATVKKKSNFLRRGGRCGRSVCTLLKASLVMK